MRIDKFLKVSRLLKRREVAKELCEAGKVTINGKKCKPMSEVALGDEIEISMGPRKIVCQVKEIREFASKEQARNMVDVIHDFAQ